MDTARKIAVGMFRATLTDAGVAGDKIDAIVAGMVDELFPIDAQPVEIIDAPWEEAVVDFGNLVATVKVRQ